MRLGWLAYVPVPGLFLVPALRSPDDRSERYHARQGGWLVGLLWLGLVLLGFLSLASEARGYRLFVGTLLMLWLLAGLTGCAVGMAWASRGRYGRVRPVWDLLTFLRR